MIERGSMTTFFFFNDTATTEIYTLSLHDALPICAGAWRGLGAHARPILGSRTPSSRSATRLAKITATENSRRSEEHTSELQSRQYLVCRLLLEKKIISSFVLPLVLSDISSFYDLC